MPELGALNESPSFFRIRDMRKETDALDRVATNTVWLHGRATQHGLPRDACTERCPRFNESVDTMCRRRWNCAGATTASTRSMHKTSNAVAE